MDKKLNRRIITTTEHGTVKTEFHPQGGFVLYEEAADRIEELEAKLAQKDKDILALADELEEPENPHETGYWAGYDDGRKSCHAMLRALVKEKQE